jgi:hypothetical protein
MVEETPLSDTLAMRLGILSNRVAALEDRANRDQDATERWRERMQSSIDAQGVMLAHINQKLSESVGANAVLRWIAGLIIPAFIVGAGWLFVHRWPFGGVP